MTFAAEEIGLNGSKAYAAKAKEDKMQIEGVLNNDIIGSDVSGNGMLGQQSPARLFRRAGRFALAFARALYQGDRRALHARR